MFTNRLKFNLLLIFLLATLSVTKAQKFSAQYTYDANGNRINAIVIYLSQSSANQDLNVDDKLDLDANSLIIKIYPNPTQGELRVDLSGVKEELFSNEDNEIMVWDTQGRLVTTVKPISESNIIDLSRVGNGTYIMKLIFYGKTKNFKIVKN